MWFETKMSDKMKKISEGRITSILSDLQAKHTTKIH